MVIDNGLFPSFAARLAKDYGHVYYYSPQNGQFPELTAARLGDGQENVERVDDVFCEQFDDVDIFAFCDVGFGKLQAHLESIGKRVFGAGLGEELELKRVWLKEHMKSLGLPVNEYEVVTGMAALREFLQDKRHDGWFVKVDKYRGTFESFCAINYRLIKPVLDSIEANIGELSLDQEFICEAPIDDAVEIGTDGYTVLGKFPAMQLAGIEDKDLGYIGRFIATRDLPSQLTDFNNAMTDTFAAYRYKGFFSTEVRIPDDLTGYMIDFTARLPSPPSEAYQWLYLNVSEIVDAASYGECVDPIPAAEYVCEIILKSDWAESSPLPISFPDKYSDRLAFHNLFISDDGPNIIPQGVGIKEIGAAVGMGNSLDAAIAEAKEISDSVKGYGIVPCKGSAESIKEKIKHLEDYGISFFGKV